MNAETKPTVRNRILAARDEIACNDNSGADDPAAALVCQWSNADWAEIDEDGDICVGTNPTASPRWLTDAQLESFLSWLEAR